MDFADLDLKTASERGSWIHLEYRGDPIYADENNKKPSRLLIKGMGSDAVIQAFRKVERIEVLRRDRMARANDKGAESVLSKSQADLENAMADMIVAAVSDWENILYAGEVLDCTKENVLTICGPGTLFFSQVTEAIREEHRLFTTAASA